jgi:hypothetical protein
VSRIGCVTSKSPASCVLRGFASLSKLAEYSVRSTPRSACRRENFHGSHPMTSSSQNQSC